MVTLTLKLEIEWARFNNEEYVESRLAGIQESERTYLNTALRYLYFDSGYVNLPLARRRRAEPLLEEAEKILIRWLATRTNGSERKNYGALALIAARTARYRCCECGYSDVRALNLDHVDGRVAGTQFACLCANCHAIKSREKDWTGSKRTAASVLLAMDERR